MSPGAMRSIQRRGLTVQVHPIICVLFLKRVMCRLAAYMSRRIRRLSLASCSKQCSSTRFLVLGLMGGRQRNCNAVSHSQAKARTRVPLVDCNSPIPDRFLNSHSSTAPITHRQLTAQQHRRSMHITTSLVEIGVLDLVLQILCAAWPQDNLWRVPAGMRKEGCLTYDD